MDIEHVRMLTLNGMAMLKQFELLEILNPVTTVTGGQVLGSLNYEEIYTIHGPMGPNGPLIQLNLEDAV